MLPRLAAITKLPIVRPSGAVVFLPGYDEETQLFAHFDATDFSDIPAKPTPAQIVAALHASLRPWREYKFDTPDDLAGMLGSVITSVCRASLDVAPGFFFDAPVQASGKTTCAAAVCSLRTGKRVGVTAWIGGVGQEAEVTKKLISVGLSGGEVVLFDNIKGVFASGSLAAAIGLGALDDRILGGNRYFKGTFRPLICATGNNASLDLDLGRRFVRVRINVGVECPQALSYEFEPVTETLENRTSIARGVITLLNAYVAAGSPVIGRGDCGFVAWNRLVRRCVLWLEEAGYSKQAGYEFGDPGASLLEAAAQEDPDTEATGRLLQVLDERFPQQLFTTAEVRQIASGCSGDIYDALLAIKPERGQFTSATIGAILKYRRDRITNGLKLELAGKDKHGAVWGVRRVVR